VSLSERRLTRFWGAVMDEGDVSPKNYKCIVFMSLQRILKVGVELKLEEEKTGVIFLLEISCQQLRPTGQHGRILNPKTFF